MLHLHKVRVGEVPAYTDMPFIEDYQSKFWAGGLMSKVTLPFEPEAEAIERLLRGEHMVDSHRGGNGERLAAVQLTLSAPKGVSIAALVFDDKRVLAAHHLAVSQTLDYVEDLLICRIRVNGIAEYSHSGGLFAVFHRYESRSGDPHLHTHALLFNTGQLVDCKWRSLEMRSLWDEKHLIGGLYQSFLAQAMTQLGYHPVFEQNGLFDIEEVDRNLVNTFSSRRDLIAQKIKQVTRKEVSDLRGPATVEFAVNTAWPIAEVPYSNRQKQWQDLAEAHVQSFKSPTSIGDKVRWGATPEAESSLADGYDELRHQLGGVPLSTWLIHCYASSLGHLGMNVLLATLEDQVTAGVYQIHGLPRKVYTSEDYILLMERTEWSQSEPWEGKAQNTAAVRGNGIKTSPVVAAPKGHLLKFRVSYGEREKIECLWKAAGAKDLAAYLEELFQPALTLPVVNAIDGKAEAVRAFAIKARLSRALYERIQAWGGNNLSAKLRCLLLLERSERGHGEPGQKEAQHADRAQRNVVTAPSVVAAPKVCFLKIAVSYDEREKIESLWKADGKKNLAAVLEELFEPRVTLPVVNAIDGKAEAARTFAIKTRLPKALYERIQAWGGENPSAKLRCLLCAEAVTV